MRCVGWSCVLNCFIVSSLPCFYAFCWSAFPIARYICSVFILINTMLRSTPPTWRWEASYEYPYIHRHTSTQPHAHDSYLHLLYGKQRESLVYFRTPCHNMMLGHLEKIWGPRDCALQCSLYRGVWEHAPPGNF